MAKTSANGKVRFRIYGFLSKSEEDQEKIIKEANNGEKFLNERGEFYPGFSLEKVKYVAEKLREEGYTIFISTAV